MKWVESGKLVLLNVVDIDDIYNWLGLLMLKLKACKVMSALLTFFRPEYEGTQHNFEGSIWTILTSSVHSIIIHNSVYAWVHTQTQMQECMHIHAHKHKHKHTCKVLETWHELIPPHTNTSLFTYNRFFWLLFLKEDGRIRKIFPESSIINSKDMQVWLNH